MQRGGGKRISAKAVGRALQYVWLAVMVLLAVSAAAGFLGTVIHSHYDSQENRAPLLRAVLGGVTFGFGVWTVAVLVRAIRSTLPWSAAITAGCLTAGFIASSLVWTVATLASGPL